MIEATRQDSSPRREPAARARAVLRSNGRMQLFKAVTVVLTLLAFTGCSTMRLLDERSPASIQQNVAPGDRVRVAASNGKVYELTVTAMEADSLTGKADNGKRYKIRYAAINAIEVQEGDVGKSIGAGLVTLYVVSVAALLVALHNLDIHFDICE
jgi:hypothetical protein